MRTEATHLKSWIGNEFSSASSDSFSSSVNPTNPDDIVAMVPCGDERDAGAAVHSADAAFGAWSRLSGPARADHLNRWANAIESRAGELADAVVREVGKPIGEAKGEVARCGMILRYFAGEAVRSAGEVIPAQSSGSLQYTLRQPLGVVALITPWNFPLAIPLWKAAPALAVGNTVVLKPAEASAYVASLLAETAAAADLPPGVFNVVFGKGSTIGKPLMSHPAVQAVSFTGSDTVGANVSATCAGRNIKFQTEMGGKNVGIVLADADMGRAASLVASGAMRFAGQKCTATSRVVVERSAHSEFMSALAKALDELKVGDPAESDTAIGPVISEKSLEQLREAIARSPFRKVYGPDVPSSLANGYFFSPTVFDDVDMDSQLAQEELFGPVLAVTIAEDLDDAISLANKSKFGLSASLFTRDVAASLKYVDRIKAGMVRVNGDTTGVDPHAPFGGFKGSSSHVREQGPAAKEFYTEMKTVQINP